jgi:hypothetical protein
LKTHNIARRLVAALKAGGAIPLTLLAASLAGNVYFAYELGYGLPSKPGLTAGMSMPKLHLRTSDNREEDLDWTSDSSGTVLYIMAPDCEWCKRNAENIAVLAQARSSQFRFIGVSGTAPGAELSKVVPHDFPIYYAETALLKRIGARGTPTTFLVSNQGKLLAVWHGAYLGRTRQDIERMFGLSLPGIRL